jgi:hypothetical protein
VKDVFTVLERYTKSESRVSGFGTKQGSGLKEREAETRKQWRGCFDAAIEELQDVCRTNKTVPFWITLCDYCGAVLNT